MGIREDGWRFGALLVDEAQDLFLPQIKLLKLVGPRDPGGFVFCADTAQSILLGRHFSFDRLKDLWYASTEDTSTAAEEDPATVHVLSCNFRTHAGLLRLNNALTSMMCSLFRDIDRLPPERSARPANSSSVSDENKNTAFLVTRFSCAQLLDGLCVAGGLGADQVVLVRDDKAKISARRAFEQHISSTSSSSSTVSGEKKVIAQWQ